jgi:hypothetical protein
MLVKKPDDPVFLSTLSLYFFIRFHTWSIT